MNFLRKYRGYSFNNVCMMLLMTVFLLAGTGCQMKGSQAERQQKAIEKRKEEQKKKDIARYEEKRRRHEQMQGPEGKRLLKNAEKHSQKLDKASATKTFFLWRWLGLAPKDRNACPQ